MTYRQAVELGAHVRKGEKGSPIVYANSITRHEGARKHRTMEASGRASGRRERIRLAETSETSRTGLPRGAASLGNRSKGLVIIW